MAPPEPGAAEEPGAADDPGAADEPGPADEPADPAAPAAEDSGDDVAEAGAELLVAADFDEQAEVVARATQTRPAPSMRMRWVVRDTGTSVVGGRVEADSAAVPTGLSGIRRECQETTPSPGLRNRMWTWGPFARRMAGLFSWPRSISGAH